MSIQSAPADFELAREGDIWVATHVESGIASQGDSPNEAVAMAKEAVALHQEPHEAGGETFQQIMLERVGIDPDEVSESIDTPGDMP